MAKNEAREKVPEIVLQKYGVTGAMVEPIAKETVNKVYVVVHGEAKYILKMCNIKREEAIASVHVQKRMYDAGGPVAQVMLSLQGDEYVEQDGKIWFLQEYLEGREFDPEKETDPKEIATFVVRLHELLDQLWEEGIGKDVCIPVSNQYFCDRSETEQYLIHFDAKGIKCAEQLIQKRIQALKKSANYKKRLIRLIHNDLRPRNIIVTSDGSWKLIDFDFVRRGDICFDLGSAAMFLTNYNKGTARRILDICCTEYLPGLTPEKIFNNLYEYYLENNFPFNRENPSDNLIRITCEERLNALEFLKGEESEKRGKLIEICGIDGSGKTTLLNELENKLGEKEYLFLSSSEYERFTSEVSEKLREVGKDRREYFSPEVRAGLRILDLVDLYYKQIDEVLASGRNVIVDRYTFSSIVYGLYTNDMNLPVIYQLYNLVPKADLILFLDVESETAMTRINSRGKKTESYEIVSELNLLAEIFRREIKNNMRVITIDASRAKGEVFEQVCSGLVTRGFFHEDL